MERNVECVAKAFEVVCRRLITDVLHAHMNRLYPKTRMVDAGALGQQLQQAQGIFSTRQPHKDVVVVFEQSVGGESLDKQLVDVVEKFFLLHHFINTR